MSDSAADVARALAAYPGLVESGVAPLAGGLIHRSFSVPADGVECVLQRVNPIFAPGIHDNISAVTEHLHSKGVCTLRLLPTRVGASYADLGDDGVWRLMTRIPGTTFDVCGGAAQARSAGALVGQFHSALADLEHEFQPLGIPLHETAAHLADLESALESYPKHRLLDAVAPLADEILSAARDWEPLAVPDRIAHGDLKFNNVLFAGERGPDKDLAVSLIDLDTLAPMPLWVELGDAWRSWCNAAGEDAEEAALDLDVFRAAVDGYLGTLTIELDLEERASLAHGLERIALELAARFASDALCERYFGWDPAVFPAAGEHNLIRARGQLSLHRQASAKRSEQLQILGV